MYKLFHNNRCSKSRECKKILDEKNISFKTIDFSKIGLSKKQLSNMIDKILTDYKKIIRTNENEFLKNPFDLDNKEKIINFLNQYPSCLQRPMFFNGVNYIICRPPKKVLEALKVVEGVGFEPT